MPRTPASRPRLVRLARGRAPEAKADKDGEASELECEAGVDDDEREPDPAGPLLSVLAARPGRCEIGRAHV